MDRLWKDCLRSRRKTVARITAIGWIVILPGWLADQPEFEA